MDKTFSVVEYKNKIIPIIKKTPKITIYDIANKTNYPAIHIKYVLNQLAEEYLATIDVTDDGNLIYNFPKKLKVESTFSEVFILLLKAFGLFFYKIFVLIFKVVIMLMLLFYTIIGTILMMIGVVFGVLMVIRNQIYGIGSTRGSGDFDTHGAYSIRERQQELLKEMISAMVGLIEGLFNFISGNSDNIKERRPFYQKVFSFVFGEAPPQEEIDPEKNVYRFIARYKKITISDAINLTGLDEKEVQKLIIKIVVKNDGDIIVDDETGVLYYSFENIEFSQKDMAPEYIWSRKKLEPKLNYNTDEDNFKIVLMNLLNFAASIFFALGVAAPKGADPTILTMYFGKIPLIFSILFFIIPLLRYPFVKKRQPEVERYNHASYLLNEFSYNLDKSLIPDDETEDEIEDYLEKKYRSLIYHDWDQNGERYLNVKEYQEFIKFISKGDPESIGIHNPDDEDFMAF